MALHPCPRCKTMIPVGVPYCDTCRPSVEEQAEEARQRKRDFKRAQYNRSYNKRRDPKYLRFYRSKEWRLLSKAKLSACGYKCEAGLPGCTRLAVEVHHVKPLKTPEGWDERLTWENLQGVCISCHNKLDGKNFKKKEPGVIDLKELRRKSED